MLNGEIVLILRREVLRVCMLEDWQTTRENYLNMCVYWGSVVGVILIMYA